jgi:DNA-binding NtrC family response regulator
MNAAQPIPQRTIRILLVEDDVQLSNLLTDALTRSGYIVEQARNGREALQLFESHAVDLVLTDLFMPAMDGMELITTLQQRDPSVRIVAMSGDATGNRCNYLPVAERLGAVKTLAKPFKMDALRKVVAECLDVS